jgi:uncharacterized membrane protein
VALKTEGSSPFTHPIFFFYAGFCRYAHGDVAKR